jgi:hypothetical protein
MPDIDMAAEPPETSGLTAAGATPVDALGLGRLYPVADLRSIWAGEAADFTPWLFANLDILADAIGVPLNGDQVEFPVGPFRLDILASDAAGHLVAIENQIEPADHNHLGQLILYAAHVNAATAVWISPRFRDEQRQALLWLNENTVDGIRFFGVELSVVRIGGSPPAPVFNVVVRPNDLQKAEAGGPPGEPTETIIARRKFLDDVMQRVVDAMPGFRPPSGSSWQSGMWFRSGPFGNFALSFTREHRLRVEAYIDTGDLEANKALFDELYAQRGEWERRLDHAVEWERLDAARASRIASYKEFWLPGGEDQADEAAAWAADRIVSMVQVLESTLRQRGAELRKSGSGGMVSQQ